MDSYGRITGAESDGKPKRSAPDVVLHNDGVELVVRCARSVRHVWRYDAREDLLTVQRVVELVRHQFAQALKLLFLLRFLLLGYFRLCFDDCDTFAPQFAGVEAGRGPYTEIVN